MTPLQGGTPLLCLARLVKPPPIDVLGATPWHVACLCGNKHAAGLCPACEGVIHFHALSWAGKQMTPCRVVYPLLLLLRACSWCTHGIISRNSMHGYGVCNLHFDQSACWARKCMACGPVIGWFHGAGTCSVASCSYQVLPVS
jgi:hypothetical protein